MAAKAVQTEFIEDLREPHPSAAHLCSGLEHQMKRLLLAATGVALTAASLAAPTLAAAQDGREWLNRSQQQQVDQSQARSREGQAQLQQQRQERGQQGGGRQAEPQGQPQAQPQGRGQDRPQAQQPPAQAQPQQPVQAQQRRADDNNGRGYRPGDNRRVWPNQQNQPNVDRRGDDRRPPAGRQDDNRWNDNRGSDNRRYDDRRSDDRRYDNRDNDRRWSSGGGWNRDWRRPQQRYRLQVYRPPIGYGYRSWSFGQILPRAYFSDNYVLNDFWNYDLPEPPPGAFWVRSGADALLVEGGSGYIIDVADNLFW
jgi:Ni/Co efflux regulator RcnB